MDNKYWPILIAGENLQTPEKKVNQTSHLKSYDLHLIMHLTGNSIVLFVQSQLIFAIQTNLTSLKS